MKPKWFEEGQIPYGNMWEDDKYWLPLFLEGKNFSGKFLFDAKSVMIGHEIKIDSKL
jgi:hypothetical protein